MDTNRASPDDEGNGENVEEGRPLAGRVAVVTGGGGRKPELAHSFYEQAARGAVAQDFVHHAAIAKERRALLLIESRRTTESRDVLKQAIQLYERWGAQPKVAQLRADCSALLQL